MSERLQLARAYEKALFAGKMDELASYFTEGHRQELPKFRKT